MQQQQFYSVWFVVSTKNAYRYRSCLRAYLSTYSIIIKFWLEEWTVLLKSVDNFTNHIKFNPIYITYWISKGKLFYQFKYICNFCTSKHKMKCSFYLYTYRGFLPYATFGTWKKTALAKNRISKIFILCTH